MRTYKTYLVLLLSLAACSAAEEESTPAPVPNPLKAFLGEAAFQVASEARNARALRINGSPIVRDGDRWIAFEDIGLDEPRERTVRAEDYFSPGRDKDEPGYPILASVDSFTTAQFGWFRQTLLDPASYALDAKSLCIFEPQVVIELEAPSGTLLMELSVACELIAFLHGPVGRLVPLKAVDRWAALAHSLFPQDPELEDLLSGVTKDNLHDEIETGDTVGQEAW